MFKNNVNRRQMMKLVGKTSVAGYALTSISLNASTNLISVKGADEASSPEAFIQSILRKKLGKLDEVTEEEITFFAKQYVAFHGEDFNYKKQLESPIDELMLMKEFVQSVKYRPIA
ncbi:hypothetical protein CW749_08135 [Vibrio sp. vnigr-6D03]|uniref:hypothetical protein n=1 Tax=Vibrio sp. vnigr-6D03 TaxID=2058088 RepID=UPI000C31F5C3|nr:hypothetical protein [Vibrio sp. vnigr-6D03]PKF79664.1 hypothetical protein CW749_08135 [Vibrio sp. vnigr-6D03]